MRMASSGVACMRAAWFMAFWTRLWLCMAPLGKPVVPEVYMMRARSCGRTARCRASSVLTGTLSPAASKSCHSFAPGLAPWLDGSTMT